MTRTLTSRRFRSGRSVIAVTLYLAGFVLILLLVSNYYLLPSLKVWQHADVRTRKVMSVYALLIMSLILFLLFVGLIFTFRIGRFFRPRPTTPAKPTKYVDAWQESGRRLELPKESDERDGEGLG